MKWGVFLIVAVTGISANSSAQIKSSCQIRMNQYETLREGISYSTAVSILGCRGVELSSSNIGGIRTIMYMWSGRGIGNMNAMFQDDKLVVKSQFGLD